MLIRDAKPLRLHAIAEDPRSVGFPRNHPPMNTFLGVPIVLRGVAYGNLYLTEKAGGADFTAEDEELTQLLAAQAAVAIENARLYESSTRWLRQLETLNEIGNALASEVELETLLVARRQADCRSWSRRESCSSPSPTPTGSLAVAAAAGRRGRGSRRCAPRARLDEGRSRARARTDRARRRGRRRPRGRPARRPRARHHVRDLPAADRARQADRRRRRARQARPPIRASTKEDVRLAETLVARAAIAVDLSERVSRDALRRVVDAQELERARLARELHDETGQALTSILLGLKHLEEAVETEEARAAAGALRELVVSTLQDVRRLAVELRPSALDDFGLVPAVERLADDLGRALRARRRRRGAARRAAPARRGRDRALPDRAGGADERREARVRSAVSASPSCARKDRQSSWSRTTDRDSSRGRPGRGRSGSSACASGSSSSAAG